MALSNFMSMQDFPEICQPLKLHRSRTAPSVSTATSSPLDSSDSESGDTSPLPRSKTVPGLYATKLSADLPQDLIVRNGFYEFAEDDVADILSLRQTRSAPSSPVARKLFAEEEDSEESSYQPASAAESCDRRSAPTVLALASMIEPEGFTEEVPAAHALLGTAEMPTAGSAGHASGDCKPCAFFWKAGCTNGVNCEYCHLCDRGEKKRRQKEKKQMLKALSMGAAA